MSDDVYKKEWAIRQKELDLIIKEENEKFKDWYKLADDHKEVMDAALKRNSYFSEISYDLGYREAQRDFSKDQGFITKEYFKGYDEAINNVRAFLNNLDPMSGVIKVKVRNMTFNNGYDIITHDEVPIVEAMEKYIDGVQLNYQRIRKQLGEK